MAAQQREPRVGQHRVQRHAAQSTEVLHASVGLDLRGRHVPIITTRAHRAREQPLLAVERDAPAAIRERTERAVGQIVIAAAGTGSALPSKMPMARTFLSSRIWFVAIRLLERKSSR